MLHFVSKNPATLDVNPLSKYSRTFHQIERKALARPGGCFSTLESTTEVARGLPPMEIDQHSVMLFRQGNFTIAIILFDGCPVSVGYAKRNPEHDAENPARSENIAVHRAISNCFVDSIRDLSSFKTADSLVVPAEMSDEEVAAYKHTRATPGEVFEVRRTIPLVTDLKQLGVVGQPPVEMRAGEYDPNDFEPSKPLVPEI